MSANAPSCAAAVARVVELAASLQLSLVASDSLPRKRFRVGSARTPVTPKGCRPGPMARLRIEWGSVPAITNPRMRRSSPLPAKVRAERLVRRVGRDVMRVRRVSAGPGASTSRACSSVSERIVNVLPSESRAEGGTAMTS